MGRRTKLELDAVVLACAASAGVHGALVREHLAEGAGAGGGFVAATVLLAALAVALTRRPGCRAALGTSVAVFAGLLASWALAVTTGVPFLHPEAEPVESLAVATKAVELAGLVLAADLLRVTARPRLSSTPTLPEGART